jgi:hypothetical protein
MRALPSSSVCCELLVATALAVLGVLVAMPGAGRIAWAGEINPREEPTTPREREFDDAEVERLFREYQRLTRVLEAKEVPAVRIRPRFNRPQGDFWMPGELRRLFGR